MDKVLANLIKQTSSYRIFDSDIEKSFCHAYLIVSTDKDALESLLKLVEARVYCKSACLNCNECKKVIEGNKPDVKELNKEGENVLVDQITEMVEDTYFTPYEGSEKLYVIRNFNMQSQRVQNKLLKTLEEPPKSVHIILTATSLQGILPTVLSRVKKVSLASFTTKQIIEWLSAYGVTDAKTLAKASKGSLTLARKLAEDEQFLTTAFDVVSIFDAIKGAIDVPKYLRSSAFNNLAEALEVSEIIFQDLLYYKSELIDNITFVHLKLKYESLSKQLTISSIAEIMTEIALCKQKLSSFVININIIDCFLLKIAEEKSKCKKLSE